VNIYFVRHGKKEAQKVLNQSGYPDQGLTELGMEQAEITGAYLAEMKIDAIYSSDLIRAIQTAESIAKHQKTDDIITDKRLREINMGIFHTSTEDEVRNEHPEFYQKFMIKDVDFRYPDGETGEDVKNRILSFLDDVKELPYKSIVVSCHGGVIRSIFSHFLGLEQHKRFNIHPSNCGISCLEYNESFRIRSINESLHLIGMLSE